MKILVITNLFPNNKEPNRGVFNKQQIAELAKLCELQVVAPAAWHRAKGILIEEEIYGTQGLKVYHPRYFMIPKIGRSLYGFFFYLGIIGKVKEIFKTFKFDMILATWAYPDGFGAALVSKVLKKPLVIKVHGSDVNIASQYFLRRRMIVYAFKRAEKIIAVSRALKQKIIELGMPEEKIEVIPNGIDTELFKPMDKVECRKKLDLPTDKKIVLFVGNLEMVKGIDILVEAMKDLPEDLCLVIVGEGSLTQDTRTPHTIRFAQVRGRQGHPIPQGYGAGKDTRLKDRITFAGARPHSEIPMWMNASDIFCLPSRNEGCPNVILEALACGTLILATRVGGIPELIRNESDGILVSSEDSKALREGIKNCLELSRDNKARGGVLNKSWQKNAEQVFNVLNNINSYKILHIFDQSVPYVSGYSIRSKYIVNSLRKLGVDLTAFTSPIFKYASQKEEYDKIWYFRSNISGWNIVRKIKLLKEYMIINAIKRTILNNWQEGCSLIHAHSSVLNGLAGLAVAKKKKVPVVYEIRALWEDAAVEQGKTKKGSLRYNLTRKIETDLLKKVDKVVVICEGLKRDIVARGIPEDKIAIVPNGVDPEYFKTIARDQEINRKYFLDGAKVIGFVGTFFSFEGIEVLVKSIPFISHKLPNVKFMIVGGGETEKYLKELAKKEKLTESVIFTGRVDYENIKKYYSIMDVLVYPRISRRITEMVTPVKPLEAMALGKTVIGSDVGGIKELIKDKETGLLFKAGDYKDLADKCVFALNNTKLMQDISVKARNYVEKERNWLEICKRYLDVYKELGVNVKC